MNLVLKIHDFSFKKISTIKKNSIISENKKIFFILQEFYLILDCRLTR
jgi:hypothetical protein